MVLGAEGIYPVLQCLRSDGSYAWMHLRGRFGLSVAHPVLVGGNSNFMLPYMKTLLMQPPLFCYHKLESRRF